MTVLLSSFRAPHLLEVDFFPLNQPESDLLLHLLEWNTGLCPCINYLGHNKIIVNFPTLYLWFQQHLNSSELPSISLNQIYTSFFAFSSSRGHYDAIDGDHWLSWSSAALQSFQDLKAQITSVPIIHHPNLDCPFFVESIGAILSQYHGIPPKLFPCTYFSHKLSQSYDVGNHELLAMKAAFKVWQNFEELCEGTKHQFQVLTDHRNLEYLHTKRLNPRQARWVLLITHFHFTITYLPGSKNAKADALSRQHESSLNCRTMNPLSPPHSYLLLYNGTLWPR